jgi:hypothetical protein
MSKDPRAIKKKTTTSKTSASTQQRRSAVRSQPAFPLLFTKDNYLWIGIGCALIALGLILMMGGAMKDQNVWDESVIYSVRRTVLAPIFILAGLGVEIYAIFKK